LERIRWAAEHREEFCWMAKQGGENPGVKDWRQTAAKLVQNYEEFMRRKN
jgi:hypothetical protein